MEFTMLNKKFVVVGMCLASVLSLTACHQRVEPVGMYEKQLSCAEIQQEINKAEAVKNQIASNRGFCGRNAVGLLFWPSIVINEVTGESAEKDAINRLSQLKDIYASKQCSSGDCAPETKQG